MSSREQKHSNDGRLDGTGNWGGFLTYIHHPNIAPKLSNFDFGSSEEEAKHTLLLDRDQRILYVAPAEKTREILVKLHSPRTSEKVTRDPGRRLQRLIRPIMSHTAYLGPFSADTLQIPGHNPHTEMPLEQGNRGVLE
jgi:hypothetical protein